MKNILVQYQGGGYSGCVWEWNFAYFDNDGKFYDVYSSGSMGCETAEQLKSCTGKKYRIRMTGKNAFRKICKELHIHLAIMLVNWFTENYPELQPHFICEDCNCESSYSIGEGFGFGFDEHLLCEQCNFEHYCSYCGGYEEKLLHTVGDILKIWDVPVKIAQSIQDSYGPMCYFCAEELLTREIDEAIEATKA
jgi:hypothetical protein